MKIWTVTCCLVMFFSSFSSAWSQERDSNLIRTKLPKIPQSMIHFDNRIVYANLTPYGYTQIQETCEDKNVWYLYGNLPKRTYPSNAKSYGKPQFMKGVSGDSYVADEAITQECKKTSEWKQLHKDDQGTVTWLDTNSPEKKDNALKAIVKMDYAERSYDPPYNAPYIQKISTYMFYCEAQNYMIINGYDVDKDQFVTDGYFPLKPEMAPISEALDAEKEVFKYVCGQR
ncbi:MAG: hypothetical protein IPP74_14130 [Alphaproteobacteria bacterium]|nr:hypothetical protein [Alphaproteobacteria bacterium]